jgi:hypothetical protein
MHKILLTVLTATAFQTIFLASSFAQTEAVVGSTGGEQKTVATKTVKNISPVDETSAVSALRRTLAVDKDRAARRNAAIAIGTMKVKDESVIKTLVRALNDADPAVRNASYDALKKIGKPATPTLTNALAHKNPVVRRAAAQIIGEITAMKTETPVAAISKGNPPPNIAASGASITAVPTRGVVR